MTLTERFRALFTLKSLAGEEAIVQIARCFSDPSALLKHECAYCLGQMEDARALPILCQLLEDLQQDSIVRHEAAEALGAIGDPKSLELLCKFASDSVPEVAETCQIAVQRLKWLEKEKQNVNGNPLYGSVDPAPPLLEGDPLISEEDGLTVKNCGKLLVDKNISLFQRYQAMFALRDKGCDEAVDAILAGFSAESALFALNSYYHLLTIFISISLCFCFFCLFFYCFFNTSKYLNSQKASVRNNNKQQ